MNSFQKRTKQRIKMNQVYRRLISNDFNTNIIFPTKYFLLDQHVN